LAVTTHIMVFASDSHSCCISVRMSFDCTATGMMSGRQNLLSFMVETHTSCHVRTLGPSSLADSLQLLLVQMEGWLQLTVTSATSLQVTLMLITLTFNSM